MEIIRAGGARGGGGTASARAREGDVGRTGETSPIQWITRARAASRARGTAVAIAEASARVVVVEGGES